MEPVPLLLTFEALLLKDYAKDTRYSNGAAASTGAAWAI